jgi:hypothetical protein
VRRAVKAARLGGVVNHIAALAAPSARGNPRSPAYYNDLPELPKC